MQAGETGLEEELRKLLIQHANAVMFCVLRHNDPALAEQAAHHVLSKIAQFKGDSEFTTWAHRIILRLMYYQRRLDRQRKEVPVDTPGFDLPGDRTAEITDLLLTVEKVLSPESYRIFTLLVVEGNTQEEAREALGISQPTLSREWLKIKRVLSHVFSEHVPTRSRSRVCYSSGRSSSAVFRAS